MVKRKVQAKAKQHTILVNDPSLTAWGWAIMNWDGTIVRSGTIHTKPSPKKLNIRKGDDFVRRMWELNDVLVDNILKYNVNYIIVEQPHGSQNAAAAKMVGAVPAIIVTISKILNIGVEWYSEEDSKKVVLKKSSGTKTEMVNAIRKLFPDAILPKGKGEQEAVADAIAIYYTATKRSPVMKLMKDKYSE